jgi:hypothetical protein
MRRRRRKFLQKLLAALTFSTFLFFNILNSGLEHEQVRLQHCRCLRDVAKRSITDNYSHTTCNREAFLRGPGQKVVAFSLFGDLDSDRSKRRGFVEGIAANLDLVERFYPGWTVRLYFDLNSDVKEHLCSLACNSTILDLCHVGDVPVTNASNAVPPMAWRFFPTMDPQVDLFMSRDLDSRVTEREVAAVEEWLRSGTSVHVMRDHSKHAVPMLGGMWGADLRGSRDNWKKSWKGILEDHRESDQDLLAAHVWPWAKENSLQHDSFHCAAFKGAVGFPTERRDEKNNFVGSPVGENWKVATECPLLCRRKGHPEWRYC